MYSGYNRAEVRMRVLIADKLPELAESRLVESGCQVRVDAAAKEQSLLDAITSFDPDVLVVRSTRVDKAHITAGSRLGLVVRAGAGVNTIDLGAASCAGVFVANCPGKNADAVAELAIGLLVACDRRIPDNVAALREGRWDKGTFSKAEGLKGRTLGILGTGNIGLAVAQRARALGMNVAAWSRSLDEATAAEHQLHRCESPQDVARKSDALSIHLALTPETRGFVDDSIFGELRAGAIFLNTSRAEVVDEDALLRALDTRGISAGLDVFSDEPSGKQGSFEHPIASHPRVYGTHHIGASTVQAQEAVALEACRVIEAYVATSHPANCVNLARRSRSRHILVVRHRDRVGVLAAVLKLVSEANLNVGAMENRQFEGGDGAIARIHVDGAPPAGLAQTLGQLEHILAVDTVDMES